MQAALVELVEDHGGHVRQQRVVLQAGGEDAFGDHQQPRVGGEASLEADVPADLAAQRPASFLGDPRRDGAHRDASWLQDDDAPAIDQGRRHARGLAGARAGDQHRRPVAIEAGADRPDVRVDRQRLVHPLTVQPFFTSSGRTRASWSPCTSTVFSDHGAADAARALQLGAQVLEQRLVARQVEDHGHGLAAAALLLEPQFGDDARRDGLVPGEGRRAVAVALRPAAGRAQAAGASGVHGAGVARAHRP